MLKLACTQSPVLHGPAFSNIGGLCSLWRCIPGSGTTALNAQVIGVERLADKQHTHINAGMNGSCIACKQQSSEAHEADRNKPLNAAAAIK